MDVTSTQIDIVQQILKKNLSPHSKVWIFGSRASQAKKKFSDLDLAIDSGQALPLSLLSSLENDFSESDLPYKVDIVDLNNISEDFFKKIQTEMIIFWEGCSLYP